jgi:RNA polymerase sigma-70 factor (ECF subfamily)
VQKSDKYQLTLAEYKNHFDKLYVSLCLFSYKYIGDLEISKDLVQDVFIKIWENNIHFNNENSVKSYLYTAVKNKSLDYLKSNYHKNTDNYSTDQIALLHTDTFFLREAVIVETSDIIEKAVSTLPDKCANIIRLSVKGLSNGDIASKLEISISTVKAQKRIAYKRLKLILKGHFYLIAFIFDYN